MPLCKSDKPESFVIPPRSNCVLTISNDQVIDHSVVTIKNQELNEDVIIANSISLVVNNKIIINTINVSEEPFFFIEDTETSHLNREPYHEQVLTSTKFPEDPLPNRIKKLKPP